MIGLEHSVSAMHNGLVRVLAFFLTLATSLGTAAEVPVGAPSPAVTRTAAERIEQMPKIWLSSPAFWIDNSHLIFSSSDANGDWQLGDLPKIVVFDTVARKVEPTKYSGYLYCYSAKKMIVDAGSRAGRPVVLEGVFGQSLREIEEHRRPTITGVDCETISLDHGVVTTSLKAGDGKLRFAGGPTHIASNSYTVEFLTDEGKLTASAPASLYTLPATNRFVFLPWSGGYAREGAIGAQQGVGGSYIDPKSGTITPIDGPAPLTGLANSNQGSADLFITKAGPLWRFRAYRGHSQIQGLFLQTQSGLERLDDHDVWAPSNVSPDGCKFFYGRVTGDHVATDPFKNRDSYDVVLINVCKGGN